MEVLLSMGLSCQVLNVLLLQLTKVTSQIDDLKKSFMRKLRPDIGLRIYNFC